MIQSPSPAGSAGCGRAPSRNEPNSRAKTAGGKRAGRERKVDRSSSMPGLPLLRAFTADVPARKRKLYRSGGKPGAIKSYSKLCETGSELLARFMLGRRAGVGGAAAGAPKSLMVLSPSPQA